MSLILLGKPAYLASSWSFSDDSIVRDLRVNTFLILTGDIYSYSSTYSAYGSAFFDLFRIMRAGVWGRTSIFDFMIYASLLMSYFSNLLDGFSIYSSQSLAILLYSLWNCLAYVIFYKKILSSLSSWALKWLIDILDLTKL